MTEALVVDLFVEDAAHERFLQALVTRLAADARVHMRVRAMTARGGYPRVMSELRVAQRALQGERPDLLVVAVDANCHGREERRREVAQTLDPGYCPRQIVVCPDPHVERWYLADPVSLKEALGVDARPPADKCERDLYKQLLLNALMQAGHSVTQGGAEFADEIVAAMDLFRAGKNDASLKHCVDGLRAALKELAR